MKPIDLTLDRLGRRTVRYGQGMRSSRRKMWKNVKYEKSICKSQKNIEKFCHDRNKPCQNPNQSVIEAKARLLALGDGVHRGKGSPQNKM